MSADTSDTEVWRCPRGRGERSDDGHRYRVTWKRGKATKVALFRLATDDDVAVLQHIRTVVTSQRGRSGTSLDDDPDLADVPKPFRAAMRADGVEPSEEVTVDAFR